MSLPPFTMSKYISELDLHKDAHAYYKAENATLHARIEELEEDIEAYRESQRQRAHGSEEAFISKLNARIEELTECRCSLRIKLVGDGCSVCNPDLWKELIPQPEGEDT